MGFAAFIPLIGPAVQKLLDLIPDPNARARAEAEYQRELLSIAAQADADQREINRTEAAHRSIFVAGWRPCIGWCCAAGVAYVVFRPVMVWCVLMWGDPTAPPLPVLDGVLWELTLGMLGMGGLRSWEKSKGIAR
jgi:hypothetical protein